MRKRCETFPYPPPLSTDSFGSDVVFDSFPLSTMETLDQPKILKRFTCGGDPDVFVEVMVDHASQTKWLKLWLNQNGRWRSFEFDKNRSYRLKSMLVDSEKIMR